MLAHAFERSADFRDECCGTFFLGFYDMCIVPDTQLSQGLFHRWNSVQCSARVHVPIYTKGCHIGILGWQIAYPKSVMVHWNCTCEGRANWLWAIIAKMTPRCEHRLCTMRTKHYLQLCLNELQCAGTYESAIDITIEWLDPRHCVILWGTFGTITNESSEAQTAQRTCGL